MAWAALPSILTRAPGSSVASASWRLTSSSNISVCTSDSTAELSAPASSGTASASSCAAWVLALIASSRRLSRWPCLCSTLLDIS